MRIAVLSDIHGALPALEAVLAEPDVRNADRVVLTGDLAAGPMPVETLDALVALGDRALWISGNADRELVELRRDPGLSNPDPIAPWAARALRDDQSRCSPAFPRTPNSTCPASAVRCSATRRRAMTMRSCWWTAARRAGQRCSPG